MHLRCTRVYCFHNRWKNRLGWLGCLQNHFLAFWSKMACNNGELFKDTGSSDGTQPTIFEVSTNNHEFSVLTEQEYDGGGSSFVRNEDTQNEKPFTYADAYHQTRPLFDEAIRCCKCEEDFDRLRLVLLKFIQESILRKRKP